MAREPALSVVPLRWLVGLGRGFERIGCGVILECGPSPPSAVREPLAVLHHEVYVMLGTRHRRRWERLHLFRVPVDLRYPGAVGERLAVAGNAGLVGRDHRRIGEYRSNMVSVLTDGDKLPGFVSSELREREPVPHFHGVLSCAEMARPPARASTPAIIGIVSILLRFIADTSFSKCTADWPQKQVTIR